MRETETETESEKKWKNWLVVWCVLVGADGSREVEGGELQVQAVHPVDRSLVQRDKMIFLLWRQLL